MALSRAVGLPPPARDPPRMELPLSVEAHRSVADGLLLTEVTAQPGVAHRLAGVLRPTDLSAVSGVGSLVTRQWRNWPARVEAARTVAGRRLAEVAAQVGVAHRAAEGLRAGENPA